MSAPSRNGTLATSTQTVKPSQSTAHSSPARSRGSANSRRTSARGVPACTALRRTPRPGRSSRSIRRRKCAWADSEIWIMAAILAARAGPPTPAAPRANARCVLVHAPSRAKEAAKNDLIPLDEAHCLPRRGSEHRLTEARVRELLPEVPEWEVVEDGHALTRTFRFPDYYRTMAFVNALAFMAHREDHHPDLGVHYDRCVVRYSTHDVGGLSENDFICAARADALLG